MGAIADHLRMAIGFLIPMVCFAFISYFGLIGYKKSLKEVA
jgi:fucose permease